MNYSIYFFEVPISKNIFYMMKEKAYFYIILAEIEIQRSRS